jgi:hypothetical protein
MAVVAAVTLPVVTENVAVVAPWGTVTAVGTFAVEGLELERDTETPPLPAAEVRWTVPVADWPPSSVTGLTETTLRTGGGGLTLMLAVALIPE